MSENVLPFTSLVLYIHHHKCRLRLPGSDSMCTFASDNFVVLLRNHKQTRLSESFTEAERTGEACMMKKDLVTLLE